MIQVECAPLEAIDAPCLLVEHCKCVTLKVNYQALNARDQHLSALKRDSYSCPPRWVPELRPGRGRLQPSEPPDQSARFVRVKLPTVCLPSWLCTSLTAYKHARPVHPAVLLPEPFPAGPQSLVPSRWHADLPEPPVRDAGHLSRLATESECCSVSRALHPFAHSLRRPS